MHWEVDNDKVKKGEVVEIDRDELQALRKESDKALKIDAFVSPETIDPLYFDGRMYYLSPVGAAARDSTPLSSGRWRKRSAAASGRSSSPAKINSCSFARWKGSCTWRC